MKIDFNVTDVLPNKWRELTQSILKDKRFDSETFIPLFKETFEVLRYCACELTDAMLLNCGQGEKQDKPITKGTWYYIAEVEIDFSDAEEALFTVMQDIESWDSISSADFADDC